MLSLFLSTLEMMGLTFVIGFFVAGVIKLIAIWADSLEFHHSHSDELAHFSRLNKLRGKIGEMLGMKILEDDDEQIEDERENFRQGVNTDYPRLKPRRYYHGVSHGVSHLDLMDYYYPQDTHFMFLKKEDQLIRKQSSKQETQSPENEK